MLNIADVVAGCAIASTYSTRSIVRWRLRDGSQYRVSLTSVVSHGRGTLSIREIQSFGRVEDNAPESYRIEISSTPVNFGGVRYWLHCPYTGRRAAKLYKFAELDRFCHRTAVRPLPTYASQRASGLSRVQRQRFAIRAKLKDASRDLMDGVVKPKRMRWKSFFRFVEIDNRLAEIDHGYQRKLLSKFKWKYRL